MDNEQATSFIQALIAEVDHPIEVPEKEGERYRTLCRRRSRALRARALDAYSGTCQACFSNLRTLMPGRGDRALEVHHRKPLHLTPDDSVLTRLIDVTVLCATCHRLIHADPDVVVNPDRSLQRLRLAWSAAAGS